MGRERKEGLKDLNSFKSEVEILNMVSPDYVKIYFIYVYEVLFVLHSKSKYGGFIITIPFNPHWSCPLEKTIGHRRSFSVDVGTEAPRRS